MNQVYHIVQGYKNWQKYFHTASLSWDLKSRQAEEYYDWTKQVNMKSWTIVIKLTFYYDSFFSKKQVVVILKDYPESFVKDATTEQVRAHLNKSVNNTIEEYKKMIDEIKTSSEYTGRKENVKEKLLAEAKECMILDNPLKTGLFLAKLIETLEKKEA